MIRAVLSLLLLLVAAVHCQERNIVQIAQSDPNLATLVDLIVTAGLVDVLSGPGPFTVFAPVNEAFARLPPDYLAKLKTPAYKNVLAYILEYHVVSGSIFASELYQGETIATVCGESVTVTTYNPPFRVTLNDNSDIIQADIRASNGVIHIVNSVLVPKSPPTPVPAPNNLYEVLTELGETQLLRATAVCGLDDALKLSGPLTVFAPINRAFTDLGPAWEQLLQNKTALCPIIEYHVVGKILLPSDIPAGASYVQTLNSKFILIEKQLTGVIFNCGTRTFGAGETQASNGVVYLVRNIITVPISLY